MDMDMKQTVMRLNFHNYDLWKERTKQVLIREGLWRVVVNDIPKVKSESWIEKDERAAATIGYLVESSQLQLIKDAASAKETWAILQEYHVRQSAAGRVALIKKLCRLEMEEEGNLEEHLIKMDVLFDKLKEVGCEVNDEVKGGFIMASLPESYDGFVTMMEGKEDGFSMKSLKAKLLSEFEKRQHKLKVTEEKAMKAATGKNRKFLTGTESNYRQESRVCYECGKPGHIQKSCYRYLSRLAEEQQVDRRGEKKGGSSRANTVTEQEETSRAVCFSAAAAPSTRILNHKWIFDSGASRHMSSDKGFFGSFFEQREKVHLADGRELISLGVGSGTINGFGADGKMTIVKMKDVLYVPDLRSNLVSVGLIASSGCQIEFGAEQCYIRKDGETVLIGNRTNDVYWTGE